MTKTITRDDVLRYLFHETTDEENLAIEKQLILNARLMDFYKKSKDILSQMMSIELESSEKSTKKILEYSESLRLESIS
jgi:hypothetical protein